MLEGERGGGSVPADAAARGSGPFLTLHEEGMARILVIDDEPDLVDLVVHHLRANGHETVFAGTGRGGIERAREQPDLIILDLMLPDMDGTEVLRVLKADDRTRAIPVIFLSARTEEVDRVVGFELGAEDYVGKPFSPRELMLRVRALLRRRGDGDDTGALRASGLAVDLTSHRVEVDGETVELTATEFRAPRPSDAEAGASPRARPVARRGVGPGGIRHPPHGRHPRAAPAPEARAGPAA